MGVVTYPSEAKTDSDKLTCVYNLIEQARLYHNAQGAIASADWENNKEKWATYAKLHKQKLRPLLQEQNSLRLRIRRAHYSDEEWRNLSEDERPMAWHSLFGDKATLKEQPTTASASSLDELKLITLESLEGTPIADPTEDFTDYTEVDEGSDMTVTASKIAVSTMERGRNSYVDDSKGSDHFGNFEHLVKLVWTSRSDQYAKAAFWALHNGRHTLTSMGLYNEGLAVYMYTNGSWHDTLTLTDYTNDNGDTYDIGVDQLPKTYYCTIERDGTTLTCKIYSDASRTNLLDTLSITCGTTAYEYVSGVANGVISGSMSLTFDVEDLDLQEGGAASAVAYGFVV